MSIQPSKSYQAGYNKAIEEFEKIIKETRRCPNCNHGNPEECCIEYFELKGKLKELKDKKE